jgi:hypothetical protein
MGGFKPVLILVKPLSYGYKALPVAQKWRDKYCRHMQDMGQPAVSSVFFEDYNLPEEVTSNRQYKELGNGFSIQIKMDPWVYGHWLGYDACEVK